MSLSLVFPVASLRKGGLQSAHLGELQAEPRCGLWVCLGLGLCFLLQLGTEPGPWRPRALLSAGWRAHLYARSLRAGDFIPEAGAWPSPAAKQVSTCEASMAAVNSLKLEPPPTSNCLQKPFIVTACEAPSIASLLSLITVQITRRPASYHTQVTWCQEVACRTPFPSNSTKDALPMSPCGHHTCAGLPGPGATAGGTQKQERHTQRQQHRHEGLGSQDPSRGSTRLQRGSHS